MADAKILFEKARQVLSSPEPKETIVGLDFNHSKIIAAELESKGSKWTLNRLGVYTNKADIKESAKEVAQILDRERFGSHKINIALSGPVVLTRFIQFPKLDLKSLKASMKFEIEKYIPFRADDVVADFHILGDSEQDKKTMKVILVAAKRAEVFSLIETFQRTNLKIKVIDIQSFACLNAFSNAYPENLKGTNALIDFGQETSSLLILIDKEPAFIREISLGRREMVEIIKKKIEWGEDKGDYVDLSEIAREKPEVFAYAMEPIASQIRLSINYFINNNPKADNVRNLYISGEICETPAFSEGLNKALGVDVKTWDSLRNITVDDKILKQDLEENRHLLPVALGLALRTE